MAGIYVHIPFCKQACHYCDFHFSTNYRNVSQLVESIVAEIHMQRSFFDNQRVQTLYFGGGTPSSVPYTEIAHIIQAVHDAFTIQGALEITLEANPDDLSLETLTRWKEIGVNRLSLGVQSFVDTHLRWMNRAHSASQAIAGIKRAQDLGLTNLTMDLIYGIPIMTTQEWHANIAQFMALDIPHLSAYGLTIEPDTHFGHLANKHQFNPAKDEEYNAQFRYLMNTARAHGFEHYEISNFAKPGHHSKHNSAYWFGAPYLGIGPSAHSYKDNLRFWNVASNLKYMQAIHNGKLPHEEEQLALSDRFNEYVLTRLRTMWGMDLNQIKNDFGVEFQNNVVLHVSPYIASGHVVKSGETLILTDDGKQLADKIAAELFWMN